MRKPDQTERAEVTQVLSRYFRAYEERSEDLVSETVYNGAETVAFGTDKSEYWVGYNNIYDTFLKQIERIKETSWDRKNIHLDLSNDGSIAWFAETLHGSFLSAGRIDIHLRMTGVLEKIDGQWKIVQFHRSVPVEDFAVPYLESHGVRFE